MAFPKPHRVFPFLKKICSGGKTLKLLKRGGVRQFLALRLFVTFGDFVIVEKLIVYPWEHLDKSHSSTKGVRSHITLTNYQSTGKKDVEEIL